MKAVLITAPIIEPISIPELEEHLRADDDGYGESDIITDGRAFVEAITRRALLTQTWDYYLQDWPKNNYIVLPFGNLQNSAGTPPSIPSTVPIVSWKNSSGTETTLAATTDYLVETNGTQCGRVVLPFSGSWPSGDLYPINPITIRFVCGWTTAALIPKNIKRAVKLAAEDVYYHGDRHEILRPVIDRLVSSWRLWEEF
jgi:uncharacterized phiE125 gp8 family phage protein